MAAPEGNQFWKLRSKHGRNALFQSADLLKEECYKYFDWCDENPWYKHEAVKGGDLAGTTVKVPTARPYTLSGLCIFLGVGEAYWKQFRTSETGQQVDFSSIITHVEDIIRTQKFEGAAVGAFNANVMVRDLGLVDKADLNHSGTVVWHEEKTYEADQKTDPST